MFLGFFLVEKKRRGLVILGAQTQVDPIDPTVLDDDLEEGSEHNSDTESIDSRGGTSDAEGEAEVVPRPEPPLPAVSVSVEWLAVVDLEVVFKQRPCLMKSVANFGQPFVVKSKFGQTICGPNPSSAKPSMAKTKFGQTNFRQNQVSPKPN